MKKLILILLILILLVLAGIYILIPGKITISKSIKIAANRNALYRKLEAGESWKEWWPGDKTATDTPFTYSFNGIRFKPEPSRVLSVPVSIDAGNFVTATEFTFIPNNVDTTTIHIETTVPVSANPIKRVRQYFAGEKLEDSFSKILESINSTYSKIGNLYNYNIEKKRVVDSTLVSTFEETKGNPSIAGIYALIDNLKDYIKKNDAVETGFPMLNIHTTDSVTYLVRVAIPVNKRLPNSGNISYKWMLPGGNILITEVKGGQTEINKAYKQVLNYIDDHDRTAPAIPFESLVTDRRNEPDSSKWITRIYYPVI